MAITLDYSPAYSSLSLNLKMFLTPDTLLSNLTLNVNLNVPSMLVNLLGHGCLPFTTKAPAADP